MTWHPQDQNLHALMDAAAEEHVAQLQRAEEASVAVRSAPSLPIDLVRPGVFCSNCPLVAGVQQSKCHNLGVGQRFQGGTETHGKASSMTLAK